MPDHYCKTRHHPRVNGFTLVELMVTLAIIGILAGVVIPSYQSYVVRVNRTEAVEALRAAVADLEDCYTNNNFTYATDTCTDYSAGVLSKRGIYNIVSTVQNASAYTLQAVPVAGESTADYKTCNKYFVNQDRVTGGYDKDKEDINSSCWNSIHQ